MKVVRPVVILALLAGVAHADAPTRKQAIAAAKAWTLALAPDSDDLPATGEPFVFDHDSKPCKAKKKTHDLVACLQRDTKGEVGEWTPSRVRVHADATFLTWQANGKRDVIEAHRKQLAKLKDHTFVHYDSTAPDGTFEIVIAVKLGDDGPVVDGFLANWLPAPTLPGEATARQAASKWTSDLASDGKAAAQRTSFPFYSLGLPHAKTCKDEQRATDARAFAAIATCVSGADSADALTRLPHGKWEVVSDVDHIPTDTDDGGNFLAARDMLDRLSFDHVLLVNKWHDDDTTFEIVVAVRADATSPTARDNDRAVIDAAIANLY